MLRNSSFSKLILSSFSKYFVLLSPGILQYSDDTAMMRCVAHSLLTRAEFDEQDMARRYRTRPLVIHGLNGPCKQVFVAFSLMTFYPT